MTIKKQYSKKLNEQNVLILQVISNDCLKELN